MAVHGGAVDSGVVGGCSPGEAAAGKGLSVRGGADIPAPGNGISFCCGWIGKNQRLPQARVELSATGFLPVAVEFVVEKQSPWLVSQLLVTASHSVVAELEVD